MDYVVAVQAPAYPLSSTSFAVEGAFAEHLRALRESIGGRFDRMVLIAPTLSAEDYAAQRGHLGTVSLENDDILLLPAHPQAVTPWDFWLHHALPIWRRAFALFSEGAVVHSGMSTDIWCPLMALVNVAALFAGQPVIFFVDIDFRQHSKRLYRLGIWNFKAYVVNRLLHDPLKWLQVRLAPRLYQLVMLKSASMVRDFGAGRPHVKNFFDTAHSRRHLLTAEEMRARRAFMTKEGPLRLVYFGRLVLNKGIDRIIMAVETARRAGSDVTLSVIGDGPCLDSLKRQVETAGLENAVSFFPQLPYGEKLFRQLDQAHVMAAAPLMEDTPRAVFDAMARGLAIVAFDISYFRDLAECSGAVALARWPDPEALANAMIVLHHDRAGLLQMSDKSRTFAADNTQEIWLRRRAAWMAEFALKDPAPRLSRKFVPTNKF